MVRRKIMRERNRSSNKSSPRDLRCNNCNIQDLFLCLASCLHYNKSKHFSGTFEPNPAFSIADEVSSAPGVRNLKSLFEKADIPDDDKPQRNAHPPVIDYMNEEDYRQQYKVKRFVVTAGGF